MFLSLTVASALWVWLGARLAGSGALSVGSLVCLIGSLLTVMMMAQAAESGQLFGLYQRLNYGICVLWVAALAVTSMREAPTARLQRATD